MKKLLTLTAVLALFVCTPYSIQAQTYFTSIAGTAQVGSNSAISNSSATYTFGMQIPVRGSRSILMAYRTINIAGDNSAPKSLNLGVVDYYDMGGPWKLGIWLGGDYELEAVEGQDRMSGLLGFSV